MTTLDRFQDPAMTSPARRVLAVCALLSHCGCRVLAANAHTRPFVRVDRRPPLAGFAAGLKVRAPQYQEYAGPLAWVQVTWREGRP